MLDSAWCLVMAQIQFSLIKKKIGRPEHLLSPDPLHPITSHFCLNPPIPPQSGRHMCITPTNNLHFANIKIEWV